MEQEKKIEGLGGWLILVGLGIIFSPIKIIAFIFPIYSEIFKNGSWQILTTPGTEAYNVFWAPVLLAEIGINIILVVTWIYIAYLFFSKKKLFPKMYIGIMIFTLVFIILDALAIKIVMPNEPLFDADTLKELFQSIIAISIWVPYMLISKRVKATFIK
jgi:magnesium-transporting ATPase (P-type)